MPAAAETGVWSRRWDGDEEITFDRLHKFWRELAPQARRHLLRLEKPALIERARRNSLCSRCNGLLLDCFAQIIASGDGQVAKSAGARREEQDPSVHHHHHHHHPWGGLSATAKDDSTLTLLDCFVEADSLRAVQNVFDHARARERERRARRPDACGAGGRRRYGTREMCALHTARPSCDALAEFWSSPLGDEARSSLLRMREEDFVEKLTRRFNRKKFCRECRKNVMREFKELREPSRRAPRERRRCSCWFCVDNGFRCEVFEDGSIVVDWSQCLSAAASSSSGGSFLRFEWAVGTGEGESDIFGFEDVGTSARVRKTGIDLAQFQDYFVTLRAWRSDDHCTQYCVKAHVMKGGESCVVGLQHRLVVSDGFVMVTDGESSSMRGFFERAEKVEEEDEDAAMDLDPDGSHTQKHAKSPELAREFLLDSASVIFKEQVVKAFRDGTAQENARSVFVFLALEFLEERVHVACKELITLEKQNKLLEEEEKEMREEQERRTKRKVKEREKKERQKQKLKEKWAKPIGSKSPDDTSSPAPNNSSASTSQESTETPCSRDAGNAGVVDLCLLSSSCRENKVDSCNGVTELSPTDSSDCCCISVKSDTQDEPAGRTGDSQWQSVGRKPRSSARGRISVVPKGCHIDNAQKNNRIPKQVWQLLDARKKGGSCITESASRYQELRVGCYDPLPRASENSSQLCKSGADQACESFWCGDRMTNSDSSGSLSSCLGERDRESSSSSSNVTISSEQDAGSSLYDEPEGCPDSIFCKLDTLLRIQNSDLTTNYSPSLLETCARKGLREYRPEAARPTHRNDRVGFNVLLQGQHLHHQSMRLPPNSSATERLDNQCWASPTDHHFQHANCWFRRSNANPCLAQQQCREHLEAVQQKTAASFGAISPLPPCRDGAKQIDLREGNGGKTEGAADGSFSLFQFSLPIASPVPVPASFEDDRTNEEFADRTPRAQAQTEVKEYKLFSTKDGGLFSFMQI